MSTTETTLLLTTNRKRSNGLSLLFTVICIIDVFGVFPIVALPKAIIDCGFLGIVIILIVCSLQMYTAIILGKCWIIADKIYPEIHRKDRYPYSALAEVTYGKNLSKCVEFFLDVTIFGAGIPNLILASQNIHLLGLRISDNNFNLSYCYLIIIIGTVLCPILWLGSPKDMKLVCTISVMIVTSVFLLVCSCLLLNKDSNTPIENKIFKPDMPLWQTVLTAYGIIAFQFDIHPTILTIQVDMLNQKQLPTAIFYGFGATIGMFSITSIIAAVKYGSSIQPSILEILPTSVAFHFAAILIALQLCLTSAVSNSALYQHMEDCLGIPREFNHKRCILRTILTVLAIILAESVPRFDLVMSLIGGTLTGPIVFILPLLYYIKINKNYEEHLKVQSVEYFKTTEETCCEQDQLEEDKKIQMENFQPNISINWLNNVFIVIIIILSTVMTLTTTYFNVTNAITYANFSKPCIYNLSSTLLYL